MDVEAVGEHQNISVGQIGLDLGVINGGLFRIGDQDRNHVGPRCGLGHRLHIKTLLTSRFRGRTALVESHAHRHPTVTQIQRMGVPLASITDDPYRLVLYKRQVCIVFVIHRCCHSVNSLSVVYFALVRKPGRVKCLLTSRTPSGGLNRCFPCPFARHSALDPSR